MLDATTILEYTYEDFRDGINNVAKQVASSDFNPDYIVGIVRGGAVPAVHLSHKLKKPVVMVHWSSRDSLVCGNESNAWVPEDLLEGKKVLLVDDIIDGGETIVQLITDWQTSVRDKLPLENLRIATLVYNTAQPVQVDFFDRSIDRNEDGRWIQFPWEV